MLGAENCKIGMINVYISVEAAKFLPSELQVFILSYFSVEVNRVIY